jgi:iron complex outermembrane receptor protein
VNGTELRSGTVAVNGTQRVTLSASDYTNGGTGEDSWRAAAIYEHQFLNGVRLKVDGYHATSGYWYVTPTSGVATEAGGTGKFVDIPSSRSAVNGQASFQVGSRQQWVAGVAYLRDELNKVESTISDWRDRDSAQVGSDTYHGDGYAETFAIYLQDQITVSDRLTLYLGARYDHWFTWGQVEQFTVPAFRENYPRRDKGSLSPKLSGVFKATKSTTLRASVGSAFRAPTLSDMYSTWIATSGAVTYASADLKPETLESAEIGIEQMLGARAKFSATVFTNELADMITSRSVANPVNPAINDSVRVNIGKARARGFEAGVETNLGEWDGIKFNAFANYTYTHTEVLENDAAPTSVGKRLTLIPQHMYSLGLDARGSRVFGSVSGRYVGKLYGNSANLDVLSDVYGSYDPYFVVDVRVGWRATKSLTLTLSAFNAFDESYFQSSVAPGRRLLGEVSYRF